ncbi:MAG: hypothetical protein ACE5IH_09695 [Thermodesulfobacteriota bacterium]
MNRFASIDVGTNTLRLLIADVDAGGGYIPVYRDRAVTRLGGNFIEGKGIDRVSASRTVDALMGFLNGLARFDVKDVKAVGTSVLRRAENRDEFIDEAFKKTGIKIEVISGEEEARLTLKGVLQVIGKEGKAIVIDIGGGSTEFILTDTGREVGLYSVEMGVVSLTEKFLLSDPLSFNELSEMGKSIDHTFVSLLSSIKEGATDLSLFSEDKAILVGTAGTPTTLAAMELGLEVYEPEKVNGYSLTIDRLRDIYMTLSSLTLAERSKIPAIEKGREDVIVPGTAVILKAMKAFGFQEMVVSDSGLLEGALMDIVDEGTLPLPKRSAIG